MVRRWYMLDLVARALAATLDGGTPSYSQTLFGTLASLLFLIKFHEERPLQCMLQLKLSSDRQMLSSGPALPRTNTFSIHQLMPLIKRLD